MQQLDSVAHEMFMALHAAEIEAEEHHEPRSPYQVLRMLPRDATPAQQDSAIQAWFKPKEIRYSQRPDTLHIPGHGPARNLMEVDIPQYYRKNFFSNDTVFYTEQDNARFGIAGDPVPYSVRGDNLITAMLLFCFIIIVVSIARSHRFLLQQLKNFFYTPNLNNNNISETSSELRFQLFVALLSCLLMAITAYQYTTHYVSGTFIFDSESQLIAIFFGVFLGYMLLKTCIYELANFAFFDPSQNRLWQKTELLIIAAEGVLLFPIVLLMVYYDFSLQTSLYYLGFILFLTKTLTFYKCWSIFFKQNDGFLQSFLYFCTLEIVPVLSLAGGLLVLIDLLKLIF